MEHASLLAFLGLVALGSYIQTVTGFAIALIVMGGVTVMGLASVSFTANVVSFIALANTATAVHRHHSQINLKIMLYASTGVLLLTVVGLSLLNILSTQSIRLLETLLGIIILLSGVLLIIHPHPLKRVSSGLIHLITGGVAGLLSGLIGAGGPPLVVHLYRQPLSFTVIRTTLLAILGIMPLIRIGLETWNGNITKDILILVCYSVPVTVLVTLLARHYPPPFSEISMKRFAFGLLCVLGVMLIFKATPG